MPEVHGCPCGTREGCYKCCEKCNFDMHRCPGCGADLVHGIDVCLRCRNR